MMVMASLIVFIDNLEFIKLNVSRIVYCGGSYSPEEFDFLFPNVKISNTVTTPAPKVIDSVLISLMDGVEKGLWSVKDGAANNVE